MSTEIQCIHFVTGRLAESALRAEMASLGKEFGFRYSIQVLPISVAALLTPHWIAPRLEVPEGTTLILLPGYALGDLSPIENVTGITVRRGPKDLRDLRSFFGGKSEAVVLDQFDIKIIAEINNAPTLTMTAIRDEALKLRAAGADLIDIGCLPNSTWGNVGDCVKMLVNEGLRVSVDSLNVDEISAATQNGAELVLSVNSSNVSAAADWGCEVVVIPDDPSNWRAIETTFGILQKKSVPFRIDPILEPIGFGFARSLNRYFEARARWPDLEMMMGIGNLTELTDVDSAGMNLCLLAICQELKIRSVLTTQVINWARSSVAECNWGRRLVKFAIDHGVPPKRLSDQLIMLRDSRTLSFGAEYLTELAANVKDRNYRIIAENNEIHVIGLNDHFHGVDPFAIFEQMYGLHPTNLDSSHAFYVGYEMCKAEIANLLGKQYMQDEPLKWGLLTPELENHTRLKKRHSGLSGENVP